MANNIEVPCPPDCPLAGMTHQHFQKAEGQPHRKKFKKRRYDNDEPGGNTHRMVRKAEQKKLYKRKR